MLAALVTLVSAVLAFHQLGANSLFGDEALFVNIARGTGEHGAWYPIRSVDGNVYVSKPPLSAWPMALRFRMGGVSELNARIGSAVSGVLVSILLFALGAWLVDANAGAIAALLLITAPSWLLEHGVRQGIGDISTTLFTGLALFTYVRGRITDDRRLLIACACAAAIGSMIKGPIVLLLLLCVGAAWEVTVWRVHGRKPRLLVLCATVAASALPFLAWIIDSAMRGAVVREKLWLQLIRRHTAGIDPTHLHGLLFYPGVLAAAFGFWLLALLVPALWRQVRGSETALLLPLWAFVPIALDSLSSSKLPWYLDPALPALALLIGIGVHLGITRVPSRIARTVLIACVAAVLAWRGFAMWRIVHAPPQRMDMHRFALAWRAAEHPALYADDLATPTRYGYREWNSVYLNALPKTAPRIPAHLDRSRCTAVVTLHPAPLVARPDFAGAMTRQIRKRDPRENDLFLVDLCGGAFVRALDEVYR